MWNFWTLATGHFKMVVKWWHFSFRSSTKNVFKKTKINVVNGPYNPGVLWGLSCRWRLWVLPNHSVNKTEMRIQVHGRILQRKTMFQRANYRLQWRRWLLPFAGSFVMRHSWVIPTTIVYSVKFSSSLRPSLNESDVVLVVDNFIILSLTRSLCQSWINIYIITF